MHYNDTERKTIEYSYKGEKRTANVTVVAAANQGIIYWFHWRQGPPSYIGKENGAWLWCGTKPLTIECEHGEVLLALAEAIDRMNN